MKNILFSLIFKFFKEQQSKTIFIVFISCLLNILKINVISFISANIIKAIQGNNIISAYTYYKYFIVISIIFILLYNYYKILQTHLLSKLRQWVRHYIIKTLFYVNNENLSHINFTKINTPIFRIASNCFYFFNNIISSFIPNITLLLIVTLYFMYNNVVFGFIFLVGNIIALLYIYVFWNQMMEYNNKYENSVIENESYIVEILNNFEKIIYRGESENEIDNLFNHSTKMIDLGYEFYKNNTNHALVLNIIIFSLIFILIYYLIVLYSTKKIDSTIFITFITILLLYRDIILTSIQQVPEYVEFIGRSLSIYDLLNIPNIDNINIDGTDYKNINLDFNSIKFRNIKFKYKNKNHIVETKLEEPNKYVINNFNLDIIANNKIVGITGVSGIGKSTLAKLLIKLYKYDGDILIDNINIKDIDTTYIRKNIIYVNQNSKLFDKKIIENILYGCKNNDNINKCHEHLNFILKFKKINELYKNIDFNKNAGLSGENISGGQRQVVNIINGLIIPSNIVILDEPTNALDKDLKKDIIEIINHFKKYKKCIIIISHDKDIYPIFDQEIQI